METPFAFSDRTTSNSTFVSLWVRAAVGSSIMMTFASTISAFAISIICCWPTERVFIFRPGSISTPSTSRILLTSARMAFESQMPNFPWISFPRNMFSSTVRSNRTFSSWWMKTMPAFSASCGFLYVTSRPSTITVPASLV